jgi:ATP/maltotriose-dependent transcriptional regulator MalT
MAFFPTIMMTYFQDTNLDTGELYVPTGQSQVASDRSPDPAGIHLLNEKLEIPRFRGLVERPRLDELLSKSIEHFPATLISGRAGTGKTATAAEFARRQENVAWYSVESSDADWNVFALYFGACVLRASKSKVPPHEVLPVENGASQASMATFLINVFAEAETELVHEPLLIVLDGVHHLFDAPWFGEFFGLLLSSLPEKANLLLLCRSKPPNPLWRLRSKQQLNVIDEKLLAFNLAECAELAKKLGFTRSAAERVHAETFGRISKFIQVVGRGKSVKNRT